MHVPFKFCHLHTSVEYITEKYHVFYINDYSNLVYYTFSAYRTGMTVFEGIIYRRHFIDTNPAVSCLSFSYVHYYTVNISIRFSCIAFILPISLAIYIYSTHTLYITSTNNWHPVNPFYPVQQRYLTFFRCKVNSTRRT